MTFNRMWLPAVVLGMALGAGGVSTASAQDRGNHRERADRGARDGRRDGGGQAVQRGRASGGGQGVQRGRANGGGQGVQSGRADGGNRGTFNRRDDGRRAGDDHRVDRRRGDDRGWRNDGRNGSWQRGNRNVYRAPRVVVVPRHGYPHRYGSGGRSSVYFGIGSGYRYGAPYYGRVYGAPIRVVGPRAYYGDVRLQVRPRDAAVYVDGYYAGIVDDFDGVFQRLTLAVGPHTIEIEAAGVEPQSYNIYVDPARTVDLHADVFAGR